MSEFSIPAHMPPEIFRAYDVRGVVPDVLNEGTVYAVARAIGSEAIAIGQTCLAVGRDGRLSSPALSKALIAGLTESGVDVIDVGVVPSPLLYFATHHLGTGSGVMLTGSHNPKQYNGLKIVLDGRTLIEAQVQRLYQRIVEGDLVTGQGSVSEQEVITPYIADVVSRVQLARPLKVVLDCGSGVGAVVAPQLLEALGCDVVPLYCEVDGEFPHHHPNPSKVENMQDLITAVAEHKADMGLALDGDADRLGVATEQGEIIWPDRQMMLFARDVLEQQPGAPIVFDVKCSKYLAQEIAKYGGEPILWKTGHSLVKAKMQQTGAALAGEMSGHIFFKHNWYGFDDGVYSAARLLQAVAKQDKPLSALFAEFPDSVNTPELNISVPEAEKFAVVERMLAQAEAHFPDATIQRIDGLRVEYPHGWGLVRASNTTPCLTLRFEADTQEDLERIQAAFNGLFDKCGLEGGRLEY